MKSSRYTEQQVEEILRSADRMLGRRYTINEICSSHGISRSSLYRWQRHYGLRGNTATTSEKPQASADELMDKLRVKEQELAAYRIAAEGN